MTPEPTPASLCAFAREQKYAVVATVDADGNPEAALVDIAALDDGTLVFNAHVQSRKVANLSAPQRVAAVIGTSGGAVTVQVEGTAAIATGEDRDRYGNEYLRQLPDSSHGLNEYFAVIVLRPDWVRVYDASTPRPAIAEARWGEAARPE